MAWRQLSKRGQSDPRLDEPVDGLPAYMREPVMRWVERGIIDGYGDARNALLERLQLEFRLQVPLDFRTHASAARDVLRQMEDDETFALDVADFLLANINEATPQYEVPASYVGELNAVLRRGGSVWEVVPTDDETGYQLARRAIGPVREAIVELAASGRAHQHLVAAWNRLSGRNPDTTGAYREAVRAVEAVAKPVVLPNNSKATLGTMIAAMRDKPEKWEVTLGSVDDVRRMMEQIWTNQLDRHGTDDETVPLTVTPEQADVAVHLAIAVVRLFAGGHVHSVAQANAGQ